MVITHTLENGVRVALEPMNQIRSIAFGIWVRNGARDEKIEECGISHFIEHMLFKGTANRSAKDIADTVDSIGGQLNAFTAREYTAYYTRVLDTHFDIALDVFSDMFFNSSFDDIETAKERNVIVEEINMYKDTPEDLAHDALAEAVFPDDPLGSPILGTPESIAAFKHDKFLEYISNHYTPDRVVIAASGNFDADEMLKKIREVFGSFARSSTPTSSPKANYRPYIATVEKDIEQLHMCIGFPGLQIGSPKTYDLAVLNTLFGGGMSSRLFQKLREDEGLVYTIYSYSQGYRDTGLFTIYAALNPDAAPETLKHIKGEIEAVKSGKIGEKILNSTKEQIKCNYLMSLESSSTRMTTAGRGLLLQGLIQTPEMIAAKIDAVTEDSVLELAHQIFDMDKLAASAVGKVGSLDIKEIIGVK